MTDGNEIRLYGSVGYSFWGEESFTVSEVAEKLAGMTGPVTVRINSGGGVADDGQAIMTLLRDYPGEKHVVIDGIAASAASLIAMAGTTIRMPQGSLIMIHDPAQPWTEGRGTEADHLAEAARLRVRSNAYAAVYAARAGISHDEAREIMRAETYYDGPAAVAAGFATHVDAEQPAQAFARFDYRVYARAPEHLLKAGAGIAGRRGRTAALAIMAGLAPAATGETRMSKNVKITSEEDDEKDTVAVEIETEDDTTAAEDKDEDMAADEDDESDGDPEGDEEADDEDAEARAAAAVATLARQSPKARRIVALCREFRRPMTEARDMIAAGMSPAQAALRIAEGTTKEGPMNTTTMRAAPAARITRDEVQTRREGIAMALEARLGVNGADAGDGRARPFMALPLYALAATALGQRRMPYSAEDRRRVFMAATHTTSDFAAIFENAMNKRLQQAFAIAAPTYREVAQRMDFIDYRPHPVAGVGEMGPLQEVPESGEIRSATFSDKREALTLRAYGAKLVITEQMIVNDGADLGAIAQMLQRTGLVVASNQDKTFWDMFLSGANADGPTLSETSRQVFNATDGTKAGTAAAITVASLTLARAALRNRKSLGGLDLNLEGAILLVGPAKETEAQQIVAPIQANQATSVNPFAGTLRIVVTPKITGNAWYLLADPAVAANFAYGSLQGAEGPQLRNEAPIGTMGVVYEVTDRFGCGAIEWRGGYKNAGA